MIDQTQAATTLLKRLIATPSFSREEDQTAGLLADFLAEQQIPVQRNANNIWAKNRHFDPAKPTLLLNSHHDTVKPNPAWTLNPFQPLEQAGKLYGLGSNDAGGCLVSLMAAFCHFYDQPNLAYNLVLAASAEEEISGCDGLERLLPDLPPLSFAIVGEPTEMQLAIAEKGLLVLDCTAHGKAGHAARNEGDNAIYRAIQDIHWLQTYQFPKVSPTLGAVKMSVTIINAGTQHNVVPATCSFTVDVRVTEQYTLQEVMDTIQASLQSEVIPRSIRLKPSSIPTDHPIVQAGLVLGRYTYGSPTTSDQAVLNCPSLKCGPGHSGRSHSADEFIWLHEIDEGIRGYIQMIEQVTSPQLPGGPALSTEGGLN